MTTIIFKNLTSSPAPEWQQNTMDMIAAEFSEKAISVSEKIKKEFIKKMDTLKPGYYATAFAGIMERVPRYAYVKNIKDDKGNSYEAEIDLVLHTVSFLLVEEE